MGKQLERIPISIWGSPYRNGSPFPNGDHSVTNPFPNRVHAHLGIEVKITIWECFPYGDHRFHWVITVRIWAGRLEYSHMGNPRFRIEFVSIWGSTYIPTLSGYDVWTVLVDNGKQFRPELCEGLRLRRSTITISCVLGVSNGQVGL